jgi:hypothetical protein
MEAQDARQTKNRQMRHSLGGGETSTILIEIDSYLDEETR